MELLLCLLLLMAPCSMAPAAEATAEWPEVLDAEDS